MTNNEATEAAAGKVDIVERLNKPVMLHYNAETVNAERREAATEIASLRERVKELEAEEERDDFNMMTNLDAAIARAETAERNHQRDVETFQRHEQTLRDNGINSHSEAVVIVTELRRKLAKATEALKPFAEAWEWAVEFNVSVQSKINVEDFAAARAITEEK